MALSDMMETLAHTCVLMERRRVPDGEGGWTGETQWEESVSFKAYAARDNSMQAVAAMKQGVTSVYTVNVEQDAPLELGDYYKDTETGETFRVTSEPNEKKTPATSRLNLKSFTAEKKALPA